MKNEIMMHIWVFELIPIPILIIGVELQVVPGGCLLQELPARRRGRRLRGAPGQTGPAELRHQGAADRGVDPPLQPQLGGGNKIMTITFGVLSFWIHYVKIVNLLNVKPVNRF